MVSSHILPELADICNKVGIIERGELLVNADVNEVMRKVRDQPVILIELVDQRPAGGSFAKLESAMKLLSDQEMVEKVELLKNDVIEVFIQKGKRVDDYAGLLELLIQEGYRVRSFREEEINLETAFMALTRGITA